MQTNYEFQPGDRVEFCGQIFTVLENYGDTGKVQAADGTVIEPFGWDPEETKLVEEEDDAE